MIAKIWLSLALCILAVAANFQIQDDKEFQTNILDTSKVSLVFLKNTDTTSIDLDSTIGFIQPIYDVLSPYDIQVTSIDCTSKQLKKSCQGLRAPAVLVYFDQPTMNPYTKKNYRQPIQYTGDGSVNSIQRFIAKSYPNIIAKVTSVGDMNSITNTITLSETPVAFLISDKDTIPVFFKSIAHQFTDKIKFLFVPAKTGTEVLTYWQITTTPLLSVLSSSEAMSLTPFTGSLSNRADVVSWLNEFVKIKSDEESASASTSSSSSSSSSTSSQQPVKWKEENNMLRLDELSTTSAFLIGVFPESQIVEGDLNFDIWREKVAPLCEGNVKAVLVKCPNMTGKCTHGSHFCHTDISAPFIYVKEYLGKSAESSSFYYAQNEKKFPEYELARKQVFESLPKTNIKYLDSENAFQRFIGENNNAKRLPIIALSKKSGVTPVLHNIALTLSEMKSDSSSKVMDDDNSIAQLGFLSNPSPELLQSIGNPILPAIITLFLQPGEGYTANPGSQAMVAKYEPSQMGPVSHDSVINFVTSIAAQAGFMKADSLGSKLNGLSGTASVDVVTVETPSDWNTNCASRFRGICAVAFLSKNSDDKKLIFESVAKEIGKSGAFHFVTIDGTCQRSFAEKFEVFSGDLPSVVAYSAAKNRYAVFRGKFQLSTIKSFYESVLSGGTSTSALQSTPTLLDQQCDGATDADDFAAESMDSSDASELLEEIRKEAQLRSKQLQAEADAEVKRLKEEAKQAEANAKAGGTKKKKKVVKKKKNSNEL